MCNLPLVQFEESSIDAEHGTSTLYFRASKGYLKRSKRKYHDADSLTISLEFPINLIQARYAHVMFSPTKNGHDYDWNDVDISNSDINVLIDLYVKGEEQMFRSWYDVDVEPYPLCRSTLSPRTVQEAVALYTNTPVKPIDYSSIDVRSFYFGVNYSKDNNLVEVVKQMDKRDFLSVGFNHNGNMLNIKNVIFNPPATIVMWTDGTKTVVKCREDLGEKYDAEKGLSMAIVKKSLGNTGKYYNIFKKWIPTNHESDTLPINTSINSTECL